MQARATPTRAYRVNFKPWFAAAAATSTSPPLPLARLRRMSTAPPSTGRYYRQVGRLESQEPRPCLGRGSFHRQVAAHQASLRAARVVPLHQSRDYGQDPAGMVDAAVPRSPGGRHGNKLCLWRAYYAADLHEHLPHRNFGKKPPAGAGQSRLQQRWPRCSLAPEPT